MKTIFSLVLLVPFISPAQLKVEWNAELSNVNSMQGLLVEKEALRVATPAGIYTYDFNGRESQHSSVASGVFNMKRAVDENLYVAGARHLTVFDQGMSKLKEMYLMLVDGNHLTAENGDILNSYYYTTHKYNDFVKYGLDGQQIFRKEIAELCNNKYLSAGGGFIYIYSVINKPALGGRLLQYNTAGNQNWSLPIGIVNNILADNNGNCYAFILQPQTSNTVSKYDVNGKLIWTKDVPGQTVANGYLHNDSLFVCGIQSIDAAAGEQQNPAFSILSASDGKVLYQQTFDFYQGEEGHNESFVQVATDGKSVYLGGRTGIQITKCFLLKLSKNGLTGLDEKTKTPSFSIYPNPSCSKFTISCYNTHSSSLKVTVRNSLGQMVQKKEIACEGQKSWELDLGKQAPGNYTIEILSGKDKAVKKVVVR